MVFLTTTLASALLLTLSLAAPVEEQHSKRAPAAVAAHQVLQLSRQLSTRPNRLTLGSKFRNLRSFAASADPQPAGLDVALPANQQVEYLLNVTAGGNNYSLIIDTGSSDTWFVKSGFQCYDYLRRKVALANCQFGPEFKGGFPGGRIENLHFNVSYGNGYSGPNLNGEYGYADLTLAGVTVPKQQIALATSGYWTGDDISTGILGLGMPGLTEAYNSSDPRLDSVTNAISYSPVVSTMTSALKIPALFSLGLSRKPEDSFLALGGVPANVKTGEYTTTPLLTWQSQKGGEEYFWYTIQTDEMVWNSSTISQQTSGSPRAIVDSGTTLNYLPYQIAEAINNAFVPPAVWDPQVGAYVTNCNATAPSFGIKIGGQMIWTEPSNMILPQLKNAQGKCLTGIADTDQEPYILGDTFMQGLVAVFDVGKLEMRFAKRV
ncbi:aspartic peptidase domain-containing protein [Coniochaeta sp. 2T2.1]|nr:aspartic peptidase domain-containing protein [Coniochaeta sp. 2T2.1]